MVFKETHVTNILTIGQCCCKLKYDLKISLNDLEISLNLLDISLNTLKTSSIALNSFKDVANANKCYFGSP